MCLWWEWKEFEFFYVVLIYSFDGNSYVLQYKQLKLCIFYVALEGDVNKWLLHLYTCK